MGGTGYIYGAGIHRYPHTMSTSSSVPDVLDCLDDIDTTPAFQTIATAIRAMADQMAKDYRDVMLNVDSLNRASGELLKRTEPQSSCVFCTLAENQDNHSTMRCSRYADSVSRITQAAKIGLCVKCLKTAHERVWCQVQFLRDAAQLGSLSKSRQKL